MVYKRRMSQVRSPPNWDSRGKSCLLRKKIAFCRNFCIMSFRLFFSDASEPAGSETSLDYASADDSADAHNVFPRPQSIVIAGESATCKSALLLQYAYNAALRGMPCLYFKKRGDSSPSLFRLPGDDDSHHDEVLERICFKYVENTIQIRLAIEHCHLTKTKLH